MGDFLALSRRHPIVRVVPSLWLLTAPLNTVNALGFELELRRIDPFQGGHESRIV